MKKLILPAILLSTLSAGAQLTIESGATFFIDNGAVVTVQGDVFSNTDIQVNGIMQYSNPQVFHEMELLVLQVGVSHAYQRLQKCV